MDRATTSHERRAVRLRALRWRFAAAAAVLLAACARWPMPLPGVSAADAAPKLIAASEPDQTASPTRATTLPDHTDGLRSRFVDSSNAYGAGSSAGAKADVDATPAPGVPASGIASEPSVGDATTGSSVAPDATIVASAATDAGGGEATATDVHAAPEAVAQIAVPSASPPSTAAGAASTHAVGDAAQRAIAASIVPVAQRDERKLQEINERAKWWLIGIAATLVLLFTVGRRKRRPQRVMKMNTHRAEPVGTQPPMSPSRTRATERPRVRMFSAYEIYAPTHESHRGPWEAPVTTERGFAHRYELGDEVADGLLFVPQPEFAQTMASPVSHASDPASFAATVTLPASHAAEPSAIAAPVEEAIEPGVPLALPAESEPEPRMAETAALAFVADVPPAISAPEVPVVASTPQVPVASLPVDAAIAAIAAIATGEREARSVGVTRDPSGTNQTLPTPESPAAQSAPTMAAPEIAQSTGATMFAPAELGLTPDARREPSPVAALATDVPTEAPVQAAPKPEASRRDSIEEARKLVDAADYAGALAQLEDAMRSSHPPTEVWVMSALCWWQIARADGGSKAYANAADAMERLLERDPSQADIWYRAGSCRLLQAAGERSAAQRATLDLAVAALRRAVPDGGQADPLRAATLGDALFERALAATDETAASRAKRMSDAVHVLRDAARAARDPASTASWKLQQVLQAQANLLSSTDASKARLEADAILAAGVEGATEQERRGWYVAKVENELAHAELAEGATRTLHLRTFRETYRDVLTGPDAAPELLLSWLELLALETGHLRGDAARSRFDEGEAILKRLDEMLPGNAHVALARARLLRRRAAQSNAVSRPAALSDAIAGLMPLVERGDAPQLQIEAAELLLDRAACVPPAQGSEEHARAEAMASGLLEHPVFAMAAARCVLQARLGQWPGAIDASVCRRLEALAGNDVRSRWLLARAALRNNAPREACGHCEAAARSGVRLDQSLVQLWDQASRQWSSTLHGQKDPAWLANRQSLRSAS